MSIDWKGVEAVVTISALSLRVLSGQLRLERSWSGFLRPTKREEVIVRLGSCLLMLVRLMRLTLGFCFWTQREIWWGWWSLLVEMSSVKEMVGEAWLLLRRSPGEYLAMRAAVEGGLGLRSV